MLQTCYNPPLPDAHDSPDLKQQQAAILLWAHNNRAALARDPHVNMDATCTLHNPLSHATIPYLAAPVANHMTGPIINTILPRMQTDLRKVAIHARDYMTRAQQDSLEASPKGWLYNGHPMSRITRAVLPPTITQYPEITRTVLQHDSQVAPLRIPISLVVQQRMGGARTYDDLCADPEIEMHDEHDDLHVEYMHTLADPIQNIPTRRTHHTGHRHTTTNATQPRPQHHPGAQPPSPPGSPPDDQDNDTMAPPDHAQDTSGPQPARRLHPIFAPRTVTPAATNPAPVPSPDPNPKANPSPDPAPDHAPNPNADPNPGPGPGTDPGTRTSPNTATPHGERATAPNTAHAQMPARTPAPIPHTAETMAFIDRATPAYSCFQCCITQCADQDFRSSGSLREHIIQKHQPKRNQTWLNSCPNSAIPSKYGFERCHKCHIPFAKKGESIDKHVRKCDPTAQPRNTDTDPAQSTTTLTQAPQLLPAPGTAHATDHHEEGPALGEDPPRDPLATNLVFAATLDINHPYFHLVQQNSMRSIPTKALLKYERTVLHALEPYLEDLDNQAAYNLLLAIPRLVLPKPQSKLTPTQWFQQVSSRCDAVLEGNARQLWHQTNLGYSHEAPQAKKWNLTFPTTITIPEPERIAKLMTTAIKSGRPSDCMAYVNPIPFAPPTPHVADIIKTKIPAEPNPRLTHLQDEAAKRLPTPGTLGTGNLPNGVNKKHIIDMWIRQMNSLPKKGAPDGTGWRREHMLASPKIAATMALLLESHAKYKTTTCIREYLRSKSLGTQCKKDQPIPNSEEKAYPTSPDQMRSGRPLCRHSIFRRAYSGLCAKRATKPIRKAVEPLGQFGASASGCDAVAHTQQIAYDLCKGTHIFSEHDIKNAYPSISRASVYEAFMEATDPIIRDDCSLFVLAHYADTGPTYIQSGSEMTRVDQTDGVDQGCNMGTSSFDYTYTIKTIPPLREQYPDATSFLLHDDSNLGCPHTPSQEHGLQRHSRLLEYFTTLCKRIGLVLERSKDKIHQSPQHRGIHLDLHHQIDRYPAGTEIIRGAYKKGGIPVGDLDAVAELLRTNILPLYYDLLKKFTDIPSLPLQISYICILNSLRPSAKFNHFVRGVQPSIVAKFAEDTSSRHMAAIASTQRFAPEFLAHDNQVQARLQLAMAQADGGGGNYDIQLTAPAIFLASIVDSYPVITSTIRTQLRIDIGAPSTWHDSPSGSLTEAYHYFHVITRLSSYYDTPLNSPAAHTTMRKALATGNGPRDPPTIDNIKNIVGKGAQSFFSRLIMNAHAKRTLGATGMNPRVLARFTHARQRMAHAALTITSLTYQTTLTDQAFSVYFCHRFGLPLPMLSQKSTCSANCPRFPPDHTLHAQSTLVILARHGYHQMSCPKKGYAVRRHNTGNEYTAKNILQRHFGYDTHTREHLGNSDTNATKIDTLAWSWRHGLKAWALDFTYVNPDLESYSTINRVSPELFLANREAAKDKKHLKNAETIGRILIPVAYSAYTAIGNRGFTFLENNWEVRKAEYILAGNNGNAIEAARATSYRELACILINITGDMVSGLSTHTIGTAAEPPIHYDIVDDLDDNTI